MKSFEFDSKLNFVQKSTLQFYNRNALKSKLEPKNPADPQKN